MKINCIRNIGFSSSERCVYQDKVSGEIIAHEYNTRPESAFLLYSNYTNFFRSDLSWNDFGKTAVDFFKDTKKVNVYDFGASDGSEAYSLTMYLIENLGFDNAKKYFPIRAYDCDKQIVKTAKNGKIDANDMDIGFINENTPNSFKEYFVVSKNKPRARYPYTIQPKKELNDIAVSFNFGDFIKELDNIEPKNCLILCRNFWCYLSQTQQRAAIEKLAEKLDTTSLVAIGEYDRGVNSYTDYELRANGFEEISHNVFKKKS